MDIRIHPSSPSAATSPSSPGRWFENLEWLDDRMLCEGWVYELVQHTSQPRNEPGRNCFRFYKSKGLIDQYDTFLRQRPEFAPQRIMELGIWDGGSVALWFDVFQPRKHVAIDLTDRGDSDHFQRFVEARVAGARLRTFWEFDQSDEDRLRAVMRDEFDGPLDLVIDDASHIYRPTLASFEALFPFVAPGGLYVIEDWGWEHWEEFQRDGHVWAAEESLTRLVHECVECVAAPASPITGVTVVGGFVAIERSGVCLPTDRSFRLREHITRRPAGVRRRAATEQIAASNATRSGPAVFVVSWCGQHDRAAAIADAIHRDGGDVRIVFSDPDLTRVLDSDCPAIRRPDHLFWADKFRACLDRCEADTMLVIQADCECDDWPALVQRCRSVFTAVPQCAVWAPHIDGTPYSSQRSTFDRLSADGLHAAAQTDGIVLGLGRPALERLRRARLDDNLYGWGIDQMAIAAAYSAGQLAVIDLSQRVVHPAVRGYPTEAAQAQWRDFLRQLTPLEQGWHDLLWRFLEAAVAVKARVDELTVHLGERTFPKDGPATMAELEAALGAARADLQGRCETRVAAARAAIVASAAHGG
jgi:hypothetical protein